MYTVQFRTAELEDLPFILEMLANDPLGSKREHLQNPIPDYYINAFKEIQESLIHEIIVAFIEEKVVGTFQMSFLKYLTYKGGSRCQVEAVRVHSDFRGLGIGKQMFKYIINRSKQKGCHMIQLTTDKKRSEALTFYELIGFENSHNGLKMFL